MDVGQRLKILEKQQWHHNSQEQIDGVHDGLDIDDGHENSHYFHVQEYRLDQRSIGIGQDCVLLCDGYLRPNGAADNVAEMQQEVDNDVVDY